MPYTEHGRWHDGSAESLALARFAHTSFEGGQARREREKREARRAKHWWWPKRRTAADRRDIDREIAGLEQLKTMLQSLVEPRDERPSS